MSIIIIIIQNNNATIILSVVFFIGAKKVEEEGRKVVHRWGEKHSRHNKTNTLFAMLKV